jgi:CBS domain-containing protein
MRLSFGDTYGEDQAGVDNVMYDMLTISEVMKADPVSVSTNSSIKDAAEIFAANEFHALPVLESGKLAGIVTTTDIIKALLKSNS